VRLRLEVRPAGRSFGVMFRGYYLIPRNFTSTGPIKAVKTLECIVCSVYKCVKFGSNTEGIRGVRPQYPEWEALSGGVGCSSVQSEGGLVRIGKAQCGIASQAFDK
jgi:hypothetical protein